jgi:hypothetical protein
MKRQSPMGPETQHGVWKKIYWSRPEMGPERDLPRWRKKKQPAPPHPDDAGYHWHCGFCFAVGCGPLAEPGRIRLPCFWVPQRLLAIMATEV